MRVLHLSLSNLRSAISKKWHTDNGKLRHEIYTEKSTMPVLERTDDKAIKIKKLQPNHKPYQANGQIGKVQNIFISGMEGRREMQSTANDLS